MSIPSTQSEGPMHLTPFATLVVFAALTNFLAAQGPCKLLKDLDPATRAISSDPKGWASIGNVHFFTAHSVRHGRELYRMQGTAAPTLVKDITPGPDGANPTSLTAFGKIVLFSAAGKLWRTDGTSAGTWSIGPGGSIEMRVGNQVFGISGQELLISDGTKNGTVLVKDTTSSRGRPR